MGPFRHEEIDGGIRATRHAWRWRLALAALLAYYVVVSLRHLTVVPPVYEDEPWFASTGWKLASEGIFGSNIFAGFFGMEHHYYGYPPVGSLLLAAAFRFAGFGLLQLRLETLALGAVTLVLTYFLGRRLGGRALGTLAVALLLLVRTEAVGRIMPTGIFFLDASRVARFDMPVAVFGLGALLAYLVARDRRVPNARMQPLLPYASVGLLVSLSSLSHLYGVFWLLAMLALARWDGAGRRELAAIAAGFALPWAGYALYVLRDVGAWIGQTRGYAPRFGLGDPRWYWRNLVSEPLRYSPGLGRPRLDWLLRPGLWASLLVVPASLLALARRAPADRDARALAVPVLLIPALFALLITVKFRNYKVAFAPLLALAAAWGLHALWRYAGARGLRWPRVAMLVVAFAVVAEGCNRVVAMDRLAATTTPYADFIARIRAHVPAGARVLGLHNYWIGFQDTDYRSWFVPVVRTDPARPSPLTVDETLGAIDPEVVLLDARMRVFLDEPSPPGDRRRAELEAWMRGWTLAAVVADDTYGPMEIYKRRR